MPRSAKEHRHKLRNESHLQILQEDPDIGDSAEEGNAGDRLPTEASSPNPPGKLTKKDGKPNKACCETECGMVFVPFFDKSAKFRTAMGEYIVPPGGTPLTREALPMAGCGAYMLPDPNVYMNKSPEWSIPNKKRYEPRGGKVPGPGKYKVPDSTLLKNKFTLGKKLKADPISCGVGPCYNVTNHGTCQDSFKYSIPKAKRDIPFVSGLHGNDANLKWATETPGALVFSDEGVIPHSFHATFTHPHNPEKTFGPGPGNYMLPKADQGPMKTFGILLKKEEYTDVPPPNEYDVPSTLNGPKYSMTPKRMPPAEVRGPSPFAYMREREFSHKVNVAFKRRPFPDTLEQRPGPSSYNPKLKKCIPWASIKSRHKMTYPELAATWEGMVERSPGPANYNISEGPGDKGPTIKGSVHRPARDQIPGPADHGVIDSKPLSTKTNAPAYSMAGIKHSSDKTPGPGPAGYSLIPTDRGPGVTFKSRYKPRSKQLFPAPNAYVPRVGCTRWGQRPCMGGPTLHGRHTPFEYPGYNIKARLLPEPSKAEKGCCFMG